jgi:hypothetical protein
MHIPACLSAHPNRPYMDSPSACKHSVGWREVTTAHVYPASNVYIDSSMRGHDGLFARRIPIAMSCLVHLDGFGFCQRRFDLFAIERVALQS